MFVRYLNGELDEEIYMDQAPGYVKRGHEDKVCRLKKCLYGLKQASMVWNKTLSVYLTGVGFIQSKADMCVYTFKNSDSGSRVILLLYVDDLLVAADDASVWKPIKAGLMDAFKMKDLGSARWFLGMCIQQDDDYICIDQENYVLRVLDKFGMTDCKACATPMTADNLYAVDEDEAELPNVPYRSLVGCLMYAAVCTRPDITNAVNQLSRYGNKFTLVHWKAAKRVLRYLKGTTHLKLCYSGRGSGVLSMHCDADWAGDRIERRSTTGYVSLLCGGAISWRSKLQTSIALSSTEAELYALVSATQETIWLRRLMKDMFQEQNSATVISCDNQGCIAIVKHPRRYADRSKHIGVKKFFVSAALDADDVILKWVSTSEQVADIMTKAQTRVSFIRNRKWIMY